MIINILKNIRESGLNYSIKENISYINDISKLFKYLMKKENIFYN